MRKSQEEASNGRRNLFHLVCATVPRKDWSSTLMGMFTAYLDDSGHEDDTSSKVVVAAGFLASVDQWASFEDDWSSALHWLELPPCFHTASFLAGRDEFVQWKDKKEEQKRVLRALVDLIAIRVRWTINQSVVSDDFAKVDEVYKLREAFGYPFSIATRTCWKNINKWKQMYAPDANIKLVIEDGVKHSGDVHKVFKRDAIPIPSFEPKCSFGALQAADILAWHVHYTTNKLMGVEQYAEDTEYYDSLSELLRIPGSGNHGTYYEKDLIQMCKAIGVPLRDTKTEVCFHSEPRNVRTGKPIKRGSQPS